MTKSHQKHHNVRQAVLSAAVSFMLGSLALDAAHAAGLGRLTVQSALGQPLRAELEVTAVAKDELASLSAKLAPAEAFRQAGLELNPILGNLRFAIDKRGERTFIKITSNVPVNEPFVDLMVELNWATGRFVREYTFLLDPPELRIAQQDAGRAPDPSVIAPQVSGPAPSAARPAINPAPAIPPTAIPATPAARISDEQRAAAAGQVQSAAGENTQPARTRNGKAAPAAKPAAVAPSAATAAPAEGSAGSGSYAVKRGDTLAAIAKSNAPQGVTLEQAIVAIYRSNPKAFFGDVNRLRSGAVLNLPDQAAMAAVDAGEARQQVRVRAGNFAQAKARLAARPKRMAVARASQSATGKVEGVVDEGAAAKASRDQLKLSKSGAAAGGPGAAGNTNTKAAGAEQQVAKEAALREATSRVGELEKNVANLQKLLELKDKQLADATRSLDQARQQAKSAAPVSDPKSVSGAAVGAAPAKVEPPKLDLPKPDMPKMAEAAKPEQPKVAEAPKPETASTDTTKAEAPKSDIPGGVIPPAAGPAPAPAPAPAAAAAPATPVKRAPVVLPPPQPEPSFIDSIMDDLPLVGGAAGALALLGGGAFWYMRRKKRKENEGFEDSLVAAEAISPNSLFGTTGGQNVDTNNSLFQSNDQNNAASVVASTEVDPIAEAEVYIAYGRESQAEDILREALKRQPERQQIRLKLAEIYAARKDAPALASVAKEMYDSTGGQSEDWPRMVTLGMSVDPNNPLYRGDSEAVVAPQAPAAPAAPANSAPQVAAPAPMPRDQGGGTIANAMGAVGGLAALGGLGVAAASNAPAAPAVAKSVKPVQEAVTSGIDTLDFDLDIDSTIGQMQAKAAAPAAAPVKTSVTASAPKIDLDFSLPEMTSAPSAGIADLAPDAEADFKLDLPALEGLSITGKNGFGSSPSGASLLDSASSLVDLSSINLDLPGSTAAVAEAAPDLGADTQQRGRWQEMATKLDLASAYEEIGDKEGAKELLDEVISGGDSSQQQRARAMLAKLA